jgi:hypothetical protein
MKQIAIFSAAVVLVAASAQGSDSSSADGSLSDVVLAHELRTAFYVHAPSSLSAKVSRAVRSWCSSEDRQRLANTTPANSDTVDWLCANQKLRYYRSIYINGHKGPYVLVCEDNGTSSLKYFGVDLVADMITGGACVPAELDGTAYQLYFEGVNVEE